MRNQGPSSSEDSGQWLLNHGRRKVRPCLGCGAPILRGSYDAAGVLFCATCCDRPDDPVTAEHYQDLGGTE